MNCELSVACSSFGIENLGIASLGMRELLGSFTPRTVLFVCLNKPISWPLVRGPRYLDFATFLLLYDLEGLCCG